MDKIVEIFNYFRTCPLLEDLWSIAAVEALGTRVILPQGASPAWQYEDGFDTLGNYFCRKYPYASVYEDYQINLYDWYDVNDNNPPAYNENALTFAKVQKVCQWVEEQDAKKNFPQIGEKVSSIECLPFQPQIRYVNPQENTVCYYITVRIYYVNPRRMREIEHELED